MRKRIAAYSWAIAGSWALRNHVRCAGYLPSVCCPPRVEIANASAALAHPLFPMILFDFPTDNPVRLGYDLICQEMEVCNLAALTLSANGSWPTVQGTLSIKTAFNGAETYVVDGRQLRVGGGQFLILNEGQRYSGFVEQSAPVESFSIFFRPGFFEEAFRVATTPTERLLDDPQSVPHGAISFIERMYDHEAGVWPMLDRLRNQLHAGKPERTWLEEQFHQMAGALVGVQHELRHERQRIPMVRAATRAELHRRLSQGRDFIASSFADPITVRRCRPRRCGCATPLPAVVPRSLWDHPAPIPHPRPAAPRCAIADGGEYRRGRCLLPSRFRKPKFLQLVVPAAFRSSARRLSRRRHGKKAKRTGGERVRE
ncbi:MAG: hypothetical protein UZ07_CHB004002001 [Chlorobi bacterium OLB7]|nr:MAG: hypothetical protein UZ07_CHB004002001 [Chlorobi bacterium OLB7]